MASAINMNGWNRKRENNFRLLLEKTGRAVAQGIPQDRREWPRADAAELAERRAKKRIVRAYMTHAMNYMLDQITECSCAFVLLDRDGCILRLKAAEPVLQWLAAKGLVRGAILNFDSAGPNAITVGQQESCSFCTVGEENYQWIFHDLAIYYAPLELDGKNGVELTGGVALIVHAQEQNSSYMMTVSYIAHDILSRISMAWNTSDAYEASSKGIALLDINRQTGKVTLTHHNNGFFDFLGLPRETLADSYFRPATDYIDGPPANKEFWDLILGMQATENRELSLTVHGRQVDCILSSRSTARDELKTQGILITLNTRKHIAKQAAERTGNNAVVSLDNIIGASPLMKSAIRRAKMLARTDSNIMLLGESGVGKDVFAQALHNLSSRAKEPFVAVNCGAIPRELIASELFGYDGGAFTGAKKQGNIGKFELANGGTLFLDEIGEMPLDLQATLLRAVEQKQFMRLGSSRVINADVKIISATNVDIAKMIREKKFRADLYYRLCTMRIELPPLRERNGDVILLAEHFIRRISEKTGRADIMTISEEAKRILKRCEWRGNVRELQNLIECIVQLYPEAEITEEMLKENMDPDEFARAAGEEPGAGIMAGLGHASGAAPGAAGAGPEAASGNVLLTSEAILKALERAGGNRSKAAELLGVGRRTLYRYIDRYGIGNKQYET